MSGEIILGRSQDDIRAKSLMVASRLSHPIPAYWRQIKDSEPPVTYAVWCDQAEKPRLGIVARVEKVKNERRQRYLGVSAARFIVIDGANSYSTIVRDELSSTYNDFDVSLVEDFEDYAQWLPVRPPYWAAGIPRSLRNNVVSMLAGPIEDIITRPFPL
jgi:hypothetical protein